MTRPVGRSIHDRRFSPLRTSTRCTVDAGTPTRAAKRAGPHRFWRRNPHTLAPEAHPIEELPARANNLYGQNT